MNNSNKNSSVHILVLIKHLELKVYYFHFLDLES